MNNDSTEHPHVLPLSLYLTIGSILLVLTIVTVWVAVNVNLGPFNLVVAMVIAGTKATLVALFFMHLKYDSKIYAAVFVGSLLFLVVFISFIMIDTMRRGEINPETQSPIRDAIIYDNLKDSAAGGHQDSLLNDSLVDSLSTNNSH